MFMAYEHNRSVTFSEGRLKFEQKEFSDEENFQDLKLMFSFGEIIYKTRFRKCEASESRMMTCAHRIALLYIRDTLNRKSGIIEY